MFAYYRIHPKDRNRKVSVYHKLLFMAVLLRHIPDAKLLHMAYTQSGHEFLWEGKYLRVCRTVVLHENCILFTHPDILAMLPHRSRQEQA